MTRRARTRYLIELGGLVSKAGLVERVGDDRAMLYGAFLDIAQQFEEDDAEIRKLRWKRRGTRALAEEADQAATPRAINMREDGTGAE